MHPTSCQALTDDAVSGWVERLNTFIQGNRDKVIAVGETGLDYYHLAKKRKLEQKRLQQAFFIAHADLAARLNLPLIIHTRNAASDTICLIRERNIRRLVIHCYSENVDFAQELLSTFSL